MIIFTSWGSLPRKPSCALDLGFSGGPESKESTCNAGDMGWIPALGRSPGGGQGNTVQYSLPGESHGQSSLVDYSPGCPKELDMTEWLTLALFWWVGAVLRQYKVGQQETYLVQGGSKSKRGVGRDLQTPQTLTVCVYFVCVYVFIFLIERTKMTECKWSSWSVSSAIKQG